MAVILWILELRFDRPGREPREPTDQPPAAPPAPPPAITPLPPKPRLLDELKGLVGLSSLSDAPSCFGQFLKNAYNNANPFTPGASSAGEAAGSVYAAVKFNQALNYAATTPSATFGTPYLVYRLKSSVFRGLVKAGGRGAAVGVLFSADVGLAQALYTEYKAAGAGECQ